MSPSPVLTGTFVEWQEPITDRSEADITEAREFLNNMRQSASWEFTELKGMLNRSDVERVISNIVNVLAELGRITVTYSYPQDTKYPTETRYPGIITFSPLFPQRQYRELINMPDFPTESYMAYILERIQELYDTNRIYETTPTVPTQPLNYYQKWNDIEQILLDVHTQAITDTYSFTGNDELYADDSTLL